MPVLTKRGNKIETLTIRQATIQDQDIIGPETGHRLGIRNRPDMIGKHVAASQRLEKRESHLGLILKKQDSQRCFPQRMAFAVLCPTDSQRLQLHYTQICEGILRCVDSCRLNRSLIFQQTRQHPPDVTLAAKENRGGNNRPTFLDRQKPDCSPATPQEANAGMDIRSQRSDVRRLDQPIDRQTKRMDTLGGALESFLGRVPQVDIGHEQMIEDQLEVAVRVF